MQRGCNALHVSIEAGHHHVAYYLAPKMGDYLHDEDDEGDTPLLKAALKRMWPTVRYLEGLCGSDVTVRNKVGKVESPCTCGCIHRLNLDH